LETSVEIINFHPDYSTIFGDLNIEWLEKYFYVEPYDKKVLTKPKEYIIDLGGFIFFAKHKHQIVGTVALIKQKEEFELSKMAVVPEFRGLKIGQQLMNHCIGFAKDKNWAELMLYSHTKLVPAINLYKKNGFVEVELEKESHYERSDIKMVLKL